MDAIEMRFVPETSPLQFSGPTGTTCTQVFNGRDKSTPVFAANPRWHRRISNFANWIGSLCDEIKHALRRSWPNARQELHQPKAGNPVAWVFDEAQQRQHVLDMRRVE